MDSIPAAGPHRTPPGLPEPISLSNVGGFAYYVESVESLSRVTSHFLHQRVDFTDRSQLSDWLTRFKELDLRLIL